MSPAEWETIVIEVRHLFGPSSKWARADQAYEQVQNLPVAATLEAVRSIFKAGTTKVPSMSEVIGAASSGTRLDSAALRSPAECRHPQPWGFTIEDDGTRMAFCRYCYAEWKAPHIRSLGELARAAQTRGVPE